MGDVVVSGKPRSLQIKEKKSSALESATMLQWKCCQDTVSVMFSHFLHLSSIIHSFIRYF